MTDSSFQAAYAWFGGYSMRPPDTRGARWAAVKSTLESIGATPWEYCTFLIWYDPATPDEYVTVLRKTNLVKSSDALDRFVCWYAGREREVAPKVAYQMNNLRRMKIIGHDPDILLLSKNVDANVMVRLELACEWKNELEDLDYILQVFAERAWEMYMGLSVYRKLTPRAWKLIEENIHAGKLRRDPDRRY